MEIIVNGEKKEISSEMSVAQYIKSLGLDLELIVVEYNDQILAKEEFDSRMLEQDCVLELIRFIGGG